MRNSEQLQYKELFSPTFFIIRSYSNIWDLCNIHNTKMGVPREDSFNSYILRGSVRGRIREFSYARVIQNYFKGSTMSAGENI